MKNILDWIEEKKQQHEGDGPRTMAQEPRTRVAELDNFNTPDLEQSPDSFLRPGETLEDWDVSFRRPNANGGTILPPEKPKLPQIKIFADKLKTYLNAGAIKKDLLLNYLKRKWKNLELAMQS